jgi:hypothetical protein
VPPATALAFLAANVSFDMQKRVTAHGVFSIVRAQVPYAFPAPFYIVTQLFHVPPGIHQLNARPGTDGIVFQNHPVQLNTEQSGIGIGALAVSQCVINRFGEQRFAIFLDGKQIGATPIICEQAPVGMMT